VATLRERIAELELENGTIAEEYVDVVGKLDGARTEIDRLNATLLSAARALDEASIWQDRANAAEQDLTAVRKALQAYINRLADPERGGPVAYRRDIAADLALILAA
jgi:uncharacterized coiled-coil DUF342 family protein